MLMGLVNARLSRAPLNEVNILVLDYENGLNYASFD